MVERALPPFDGDGLVLGDSAIFVHHGEVTGIAEPPEHPAFIDRMQSVDDDDGPYHRYAGGDHALAEATQHIRLGRPNQAGVGDPGGDVGFGAGVQAMSSD